MNTEAEIRIKGMQALLGALRLVDAERFMAATSRGRFNYTEKMASFQTLDDLRREAALGKREDFEQFLKLVADAPAQVGDELSPDSHMSSKTRNKKL